MLILLPPSETKASGGDSPPLEVDGLSFGELNPVRRELLDALAGLAADVPASRAALGLSVRQDDEVARNAAVRSSPTAPALSRYTGVLYDALDAGSFTRFERARAGQRLVVASALFGLLRPDDLVPAYRLSGGTSLPGVGTLRSVWRPELAPVLEKLPEPVVDLRSGDYAALGPMPGAITVRVVTADGRTVSHFNKAAKGRLAAAWVRAPREPSTVRGLMSIAERAGLPLRRTGDRELELVTVG